MSDLRDKTGQLGNLTGLRFIAALAVFLSHVREHLFDGATLWLFGGPAVSFFFVLSGFILTYVYHDRLREVGLRRFYLTRFARIWPLHLVCLALALILTSRIRWDGGTTADGPASFIAQLTLLHSWIPIRDWMYGFNSVSWSISTEAFFYLAFPVLLLAPRRFDRWVFPITLGVALAILAIANHYFDATQTDSRLHLDAMAICHPLLRLPEFVLGIVVCRKFVLPTQQPVAMPVAPTRFFRDSMLEILAVAIVAGMFFLMIKSNISIKLAGLAGPVFAPWLRVVSGMFVFAFTIVVFARCRGLMSMVFGSTFFMWLGEISYAFYLVHQTIIRSMQHFSLHGWLFVVVAFSISLFASALLFRLVEMPCKTAILAIRNEGFRSAGLRIFAGLGSVVNTRFGFMQLAGLLLSIGLLFALPQFDNQRKTIAQVIGNSLERFQNIGFENEATLLGAEIERTTGGRRIRLVWQLDPKQSRSRFLHVTNIEGEIVAKLPLNSFRGVRGTARKEPVLDEIWLPNQKLIRGFSVGIGFWSEQAGTAPLIPIPSGLRELDPVDNCLELFEIKQREWK